MNKKYPSEYNSWRAMRMRCLNKSANQYKYYGERGIAICEKWNTFDGFLDDMGEKPSPDHTIDRINNDGNYEPSNCRWVHKTKQSKNSRNTRWITYQGITDSCEGWAKRVGISGKFLRQRLSRGWSVERALTCPAFDRGQNA
jgi:hypothetical protein